MRAVSYDEFKKATESDLVPMRVAEGTMGMISLVFEDILYFSTYPAFMFETSMMLTITDYAMHRSGKLHGKSFSDDSVNYLIHLSVSEHEPKMWDDLKSQFMEHLDEVQAELQSAGLSKSSSGARS